MYQVYWELKVKFKERDTMEKFYDPKGEWVRFFQKSKGYEGTEVLESGEGDNVFLVIDEWQSEEDFNTCIQARKADFAALEEKANAASRSRKRIFISFDEE